MKRANEITIGNVADATGIPLSTLQRSEGQDDVRIGYQDISALAEFYDVSTDYFFGLTDNRQPRNVNIDELKLSDRPYSPL